MKVSVNAGISGKKIFVGLSGGVDSSVTAALLARHGAHVTGVFIKGWYPPGMPCSWRDDRRDAMRVAAHLRIPFVTLDASEDYKRAVIDYLLREYKKGRTPNPDIMCNREVKFGAFHAYAKAQGADFIATGHYAQAVHTESATHLLRGIDPEKDQSYFLWAISRNALNDSLFPLGGMHKHEVRKLAQKFALPNALKRDSQGICFLGNISLDDFLTSEFGTEGGTAIDTEGNVIGTHAGAILATLGQRVALESTLPGPWYVVAKDSATNTLTVSHERIVENQTSFTLEQTNWLKAPVSGKTYRAQYRYHGPKVEGIFDMTDSRFTPTQPVRETIAGGQSLVLYDEEECIGGGIIA